MHDGETRGVAGVYDLLGGGGIEIGGRFDGQDEYGIARQRELEGAGRIADGDDGFVGAGRQTEADAGAGFIHNPDFLIFDRDRIGGAHPYAGKACDTQLRVDSKIHASSGRALEALLLGSWGPG